MAPPVAALRTIFDVTRARAPKVALRAHTWRGHQSSAGLLLPYKQSPLSLTQLNTRKHQYITYTNTVVYGWMQSECIS
jgi:hypothetical protein